MGYRNIVVRNPAKISVRNRQLIICTDKEYPVPIEDISSIMLENKQITVTTAALSSLGQNGCAVFVCDDKHLPCSVLEPYAQHSRELKTTRAQLESTQPFKKRLWQSIVKSKITNQAICLELTGKNDSASGLKAMSDEVKSGDSGNIEAAAARRYFVNAVSSEFTRDAEDIPINAFLNYGYAIIRGYISKEIPMNGLLPSIGLHHHSELNNFNLADDIIEPYRPIVDLFVFSILFDETELSPRTKQLLFNVLDLDIEITGKKYTVSRAIELTVQSLATSFKEKENKLLLPKLVNLNQHSYE